MKKKLLYEVPEAEQFFVKIEADFLQGSPVAGSAGNGFNPDNNLGGLGDEDDEG